KLPPSILERAYKQLLNQKCNPISPDQIIEKHDQIENHLRNALKVYERYKARNKKKPSSTSLSIILPTNKSNPLVHSSDDMITQNSDPVESILKDMEQLLDTKSYASQNKSLNITYTEEEFNA
ncbi:2969_t:CDS:1, partial [Ambispora leptoticha]